MTSSGGGLNRPSGPTKSAFTRCSFARTSGSIIHRVKSACSVNAIDVSPSCSARAHVRSIEPAAASQDHSVCTCPSSGSTRAHFRSSALTVPGQRGVPDDPAGAGLSRPGPAGQPGAGPGSTKLSQVIDLKAARKDPDRFRAALARRGAAGDFDALLAADAPWRELTERAEALRARQKRSSRSAPTGAEQLAELRRLRDQLDAVQADLAEAERVRSDLLAPSRTSPIRPPRTA